MLYFTDGKGIYPSRRPPYDVAFLFLDTGEPAPDVPPWAMRLTLEHDEFIKPKAPKLPDFELTEDPDDLPDDGGQKAQPGRSKDKAGFHQATSPAAVDRRRSMLLLLLL